LRLYADPDRLVERLPTLRALARPAAQIRAAAERIRPLIADRLGPAVSVDVIECASQVGSGALPTQRIASAGLSIAPLAKKRGAGAALSALAAAFRALPVPVIGRIQDDAFILDLRCLEDDSVFVGQLKSLVPGR